MGLRPEYVRARLKCLTQRHPKLIALLRSLEFPWEVVEEAAQDAVLVALDALQNGKVCSIRKRWPWLKRVAINRATVICRRRSLQSKLLKPLDQDVAIDPIIDDWVLCETVRSEVKRLPVMYRELVTYRYLEEHSHAETMELFNLTDGALRRRLQSARLVLWLRLKKSEDCAQYDAPGAPEL